MTYLAAETGDPPGWQRLSLAAVLGTMLVAAGCSPPAPDEAGYIDRLLEDRALKDEVFAEGPDSPVRKGPVQLLPD